MVSSTLHWVYSQESMLVGSRIQGKGNAELDSRRVKLPCVTVGSVEKPYRWATASTHDKSPVERASSQSRLGRISDPLWIGSPMLTHVRKSDRLALTSSCRPMDGSRGRILPVHGILAAGRLPASLRMLSSLTWTSNLLEGPDRAACPSPWHRHICRLGLSTVIRILCSYPTRP